MTCKECEKIQGSEITSYYRWNTATVEVRACPKHLKEIYDVLNEHQSRNDAAAEFFEGFDVASDEVKDECYAIIAKKSGLLEALCKKLNIPYKNIEPVEPKPNDFKGFVAKKEVTTNKDEDKTTADVPKVLKQRPMKTILEEDEDDESTEVGIRFTGMYVRTTQPDEFINELNTLCNKYCNTEEVFFRYEMED